MSLRGHISTIGTIAVVITIWSVASSTVSAEGTYRLNEGAGALYVMGKGRPSSTMRSPVQARLMAERAAVVDAYATAARVLSAALPQTSARQDGYSVFLRGSKVTRSEVAADGTAEVELEIPVSPDLARRVREIMP